MKVIIKKNLFERLAVYRENTSFKKTEELVDYILEEYLNNNKDQNFPDNKSDKEILNKRLKNLGYL